MEMNMLLQVGLWLMAGVILVTMLVRRRRKSTLRW
jgi:hypothetical protein